MKTETDLAGALERRGLKQKALAELVGESPQVVSYWVKRGYVPPEKVRHVQAKTGIPSAELCPHIFGEAA